MYPREIYKMELLKEYDNPVILNLLCKGIRYMIIFLPIYLSLKLLLYMSSLQRVIVAFIVTIFFIRFILLLFVNIVNKEKLKILSKEISRLKEQDRGDNKDYFHSLEPITEITNRSLLYRKEQKESLDVIKEHFKHSTPSDNEIWEEIEQYLDENQNYFAEKLVNSFPALSPDDIHIIWLMRLNIPNADIAAFYHIQQASLATRRYRLMKKMKVEKQDSIILFINRLFNDEPS